MALPALRNAAAIFGGVRLPPIDHIDRNPRLRIVGADIHGKLCGAANRHPRSVVREAEGVGVLSARRLEFGDTRRELVGIATQRDGAVVQVERRRLGAAGGEEREKGEERVVLHV